MKKLWIMSLCSLLLTSSLLMAEDTAEHIPVGTRAKPKAELIAHKAACAEMVAKNLGEDGNTLPTSKANLKSVASRAVAKSVAKGIFHTAHPGAYHRAISLTPISIELEDGSIWLFHPSDSYITASWFPTDLIVITPNHSIFSSYDYRLTNQNTGTSVVVNLSMGPIYNAPFTHWIQAIDYYNNTLYLDDGSIWNMSSFDNGIVGQWLLNDTVIIGVNDGWLSSGRPNILINVNMLNYAAGISY